MNAYSIDVEFSSHDDLRHGIVAVRTFGAEATWHRVTVAAETPEEAELIAAQMVACHHMPTATYPRM
jgi:hypothetical protein